MEDHHQAHRAGHRCWPCHRLAHRLLLGLLQDSHRTCSLRPCHHSMCHHSMCSRLDQSTCLHRSTCSHHSAYRRQPLCLHHICSRPPLSLLPLSHQQRSRRPFSHRPCSHQPCSLRRRCRHKARSHWWRKHRARIPMHRLLQSSVQLPEPTLPLAPRCSDHALQGRHRQVPLLLTFSLPHKTICHLAAHRVVIHKLWQLEGHQQVHRQWVLHQPHHP
mmetsp:Transcript_6965/g.11965  ORF Transcript_6965/g.11965 Transcript_6965/m.11965 type:complete len:217 (+) Transcript_6965:69-719(+)